MGLCVRVGRKKEINSIDLSGKVNSNETVK